MTEIMKMLASLGEGDGATLEGYAPVNHAKGYQVAFHGVETKDLETAANAVERFEGNCGLWFENGTWYVDKSYRIRSHKLAKKLGKKHEQISIFRWFNQDCEYLKK